MPARPLPPLPEGTVSYSARLAQLGAQHRDEVALVFGHSDGRETRYTWHDLEEWARGLAHVLAARGVTAGDRVAIALSNSPEHVVGAQATWKLGATAVPLRWDVPDWERQRILDVAEPALVVGDWDVAGRPTISRAEVASVKRGGAALPDAIAMPATAVASGGATGRPKLIVTPLPSAAVPGAAPQVTSSGFPGGPGQVQLVPGPLYHTNGFAICHNSLFEFQRVVLLESFDAERVVDVIERHRVTLMTMAPTMMTRIARLPGVDQRDFSSLRGVMQGAAACPQWLFRKWIDLVGAEQLFAAYGSTERVGLSMIRGDDWLQHPGSVGTGMATDIRILDQAGHDVAVGEIGEIFMRSQVTLDAPTFEYVGAPPAPRTADGFTSIGDVGWLDADGYLYVADRRVDMIVSGGANVFPAEVEAALGEHDAVADVAVIGVPDEEWGHRVVALVQAIDPDAPPSPAVLDQFARARLTAYKVPRAYEFGRALPRHATGKLNRSALVAERTGTRPDAAEEPAR